MDKWQKIRVFLAGATVCFCFVLLLGAGGLQEAEIGRYQLVAGEYTIISAKGAPASLPTMFKIDTATGDAWRYYSGYSEEGKRVDFWTFMGKLEEEGE